MIRILPPTGQIKGSIAVGGSKSLSNRLLILSEVLGQSIRFKNLSDSEDTRALQKALSIIRTAPKNEQRTIDIGKAGTDMRFLTAFLALTEGDWLLTGSDRMKQRPIAQLVDALRHLGADIEYAEHKNYPPLKIKGRKITGGEITIKADVSSQFISALLLVAPAMERGLTLNLGGTVVSRPYIDMTLDVLRSAGIELISDDKFVRIEAKTNKAGWTKDLLMVESDWSSASYWYSICALGKNAVIKLRSFDKVSSQADSVLPEIYKSLGVETTFKDDFIELTNTTGKVKRFNYNFSNCPDLAQTVALSCFALGIPSDLRGLSTLKIKETDRIEALKAELLKMGAGVEAGNDFIRIEPAKQIPLNPETIIQTYDDHRMAMSFAPLCLVTASICIADPMVIGKSYPGFWHDLKSLGFSVNLQA